MLYRRYFGGASLLAKRISLFTERLPVFDFQADKHQAHERRYADHCSQHYGVRCFHGDRPEVAEWLCKLDDKLEQRGFLSQELGGNTLLPVEQLLAILYLGISRVLDLDPRLTVLAFLRLHDNALEIEVAREIVEVRTVVGVINIEQMGSHPGMSCEGPACASRVW